MENKRLGGTMLAVALVLLIPLIAGFLWTLLDFVVAGAVLIGTARSCELVMIRANKIEYRIASCGGILAVLVLVWAGIVDAE